MSDDDRNQAIRHAWTEKPDTEPTKRFDTRMAAAVGCSSSMAGKLRRRMNLTRPARTTPAHVLAARLDGDSI